MIWTNVTVKLADLQPWEHNPRTMTKRQAQRLLKSWKDLGQFQTIAIGPQGQVYDGHQRLSALMTAYGAQYQIEARQCERELSEDERRYLITQANLPVGAWRFEEIAGWPEAQEWGFDAEMLATWNADGAALATMLEAEQPNGDADAEPQIDRAAELNEKWQVKTGDLWRIGEHRLLCGDSTKREDVERVMQGEKAGACVTDPLYGLGDSKSFNDDHENYADDKPTDLTTIDLSMPFIVWGGNYYDPLPEPRNKIGWIVWDKRPDLEGEKRERADRIFGQHFEIAITNIGSLRGKMLRYRWGGYYGSEEIMHKTQKPIALFSECVAATIGDVVDWFAGSGTTLVACQNLQRKCRAIEISPNYCAVILERMATAFPGIEIERIES